MGHFDLILLIYVIFKFLCKPHDCEQGYQKGEQSFSAVLAPALKDLSVFRRLR